MSQLYDYLLTAYKVLVGLLTTKRLILVALSAFGFYLIWICVSLYFSFQRKFGKHCSKLAAFIRKNQMDSTNLQVLDIKMESISSGFYHGWKKFKTSVGKKPSDFINRRESLDVEVSGGVLNQGKTIMRAFISLTTAVLALFNFAYLGNNATITSYLIAESLVLPLVYYAIMKLFYFLYTSIKQQLYKQDIEYFYDLIALLDDTFGVNETVVMPQAQTPVQVVVEESAGVPDESAELAEGEEAAESIEEEQPKEELEEDDPLKTLDKYDVFKKKNIDVDKIINEVPHNAGTSLPYINVDSDYVIKDDESRETVKIVTEEDTATSILGGMMQDRASLKKNNENFLDVEKEVAEIDEEKIAEAKAEAEAKEEKPAEDDPFGGLGAFEVAENATVAAESEEPAETKEEEKTEDAAVENEESTEAKEEPEETPVVEEEKKEEPIVIVPENDDEVSEEDKESIAIAVSGFKAKKSKLASGGVVIERNQPIVRRERPVQYEEPEPVEEYIEPEPVMAPEYPTVPAEIRQLNVNENTDSILNSIKTSAGGYDYGYDPYAQQPGYPAQQGYGNPYAQQPGYPAQQGYAANPYGQNYAGYGQDVYSQGYQQQPVHEQYSQGYDSYEEPVEEDVYEEEAVEEIAPVKKQKKVRSKEDEPRPRNLRKKETKVEEIAQAKTRGRPKKQEVSESMTIKSDKEFDEVLSRAEKLMRKSEEGLSASQSKRIEKELKMLMDAMNRYKENK